MLELYEPAGAFEQLAEYVAAAGCDVDVFLGYGLSDPLRRDDAPAPPEPCRLPLLAARPTSACVDSTQSGFSAGEWTPTWNAAGYAAAIGAVRAAIARGDVYQVNLVQHLSAPFRGDPRALTAALAALRPLHGRALTGDSWAIVSASPELFLARRGDLLVTRPIKGTRPLGEDVDDEKDAAEHMMIVDLERNDLSRVCEPGTVRWPELMRQRELAGVTHLESTVEGRLRPGTGLAEILRATFPGGSITGAPKISALDHIARLEPVGRGASMGALGRVYPNGDLDLALTIRTFAVADARIHLWVGGGIVWDSVPEAEIEESLVKARPLLELIGAPLPESRSGAGKAGTSAPGPPPSSLRREPVAR
jgi:para-aminobenzoate synthetase component I